MTDLTVIRYGTDTSGRPIFMTAFMRDWLECLLSALPFKPTIVQGAFMTRVPGGGADDSAGYHDLGGCLDFRIWDLSLVQQELLVRTIRIHGAGGWRRDARHGGMDPHCHIILGTDSPLTPGAAAQWVDYKNGRDGLSGGGKDYEWRPSPLVTEPELDMPLSDADLAKIRAIVHEEAKAILDEEHVDKAGEVTVRQSLNQTRNDAAKAASK